MIEYTTTIKVKDITSNQIIDFMITCTDTEYNNWWPGTHITFHELNHKPGNIGSSVYFDEFVGPIRLKFHAIISDYIPDKLIGWQMKKLILLPVKLILQTEQKNNDVILKHSLLIGFKGILSILDPVIKVFIPGNLESELNKHARHEFGILPEILKSRRN
jgi:hypothetical protein